jgi:integration host factor subunit beta
MTSSWESRFATTRKLQAMLLVNVIPAEDNMKKSELLEALRSETKMTKSKSEEVVELFFSEISDALARGDRVEIRGFCSFFTKQYKSYIGKNPKTGKPVQVAAKKLPFFKCGKELRERVDYE